MAKIFELFRKQNEISDNGCYIMLLGDGRVMPVARTDVYDFCSFYKSCVALMTDATDEESDDERRVEEAVKLAVKLTALR
jgi:hypothetical protein